MAGFHGGTLHAIPCYISNQGFMEEHFMLYHVIFQGRVSGRNRRTWEPRAPMIKEQRRHVRYVGIISMTFRKTEFWGYFCFSNYLNFAGIRPIWEFVPHIFWYVCNAEILIVNVRGLGHHTTSQQTPTRLRSNLRGFSLMGMESSRLAYKAGYIGYKPHDTTRWDLDQWGSPSPPLSTVWWQERRRSHVFHIDLTYVLEAYLSIFKPF